MRNVLSTQFVNACILHSLITVCTLLSHRQFDCTVHCSSYVGVEVLPTWVGPHASSDCRGEVYSSPPTVMTGRKTEHREHQSVLKISSIVLSLAIRRCGLFYQYLIFIYTWIYQEFVFIRSEKILL